MLLHFHKKNGIISDIRHNNIDVYKAVKDKSQFDILLQKVEETKQITDKKELEKLFYYWRDEISNCDTLWESLSMVDYTTTMFLVWM